MRGGIRRAKSGHGREGGEGDSELEPIPFLTWVVIVLNDFPHPILFEVNHPRFKMRNEDEDP